MAIKATGQITLVDLTDAYSVILSSETYTFVGGVGGVGSGQSCTTEVAAFCGSNQCTSITVNVADIVCPTGIIAKVSNSGTAKVTITFTTTATISSACEATIPVTVDGITVNKKFSFAVAKTGATGATGKGIKSTEVTYQAGASGTTAPTGTWEEVPPETSTDKPYLWTRTIITYTDNTTSTSYSVGVPPNSVVSKGDVVNQVNAELLMDGNVMKLKAGHFLVESDGLNLDEKGNAVFKGAVKASSGEFTKEFYVAVPVPMTTGGDATQIMKVDKDNATIMLSRGDAEDVAAMISNIIQMTSDGVEISSAVGKAGGVITFRARAGMLFRMDGAGTFKFSGAAVEFDDVIAKWMQIDASSAESGVMWTGLKGSTGSGNIILTCKPSGDYSQFLAYDNCANSYIWYYNTKDRYFYFNSTVRPMGNIVFDYNKIIYWGSTSGPKMYSTGNQHLSLFGSSEAPYALHLGVHDGMWSLDPDANGNLALGTPNHRWGQIYSTSAAISTSDRNEKKDISALFEDDRYVKFFKMLIPVSFKMKKGESGRTHVGFISQDVEAAMLECGISDLEFAGFCRDQKTVQVKKFRMDKTVSPETGEEIQTEVEYTEDEVVPGEYVYSLRYEEFIALNTAMIQVLDERIEKLEDRLSGLENTLKEFLSAKNI